MVELLHFDSVSPTLCPVCAHPCCCGRHEKASKVEDDDKKSVSRGVGCPEGGGEAHDVPGESGAAQHRQTAPVHHERCACQALCESTNYVSGARINAFSYLFANFGVLLTYYDTCLA